MAIVGDLYKAVRNEYSAAPYKVLNQFENGIEERKYPGQKWVVCESSLEKGQRDAKMKDMFLALFGYISGKNEKSQKISMTVPVSTKVIEASLVDEPRLCQMGFWVPDEFQKDTPEPLDPRVKIVERDLHVYTITFGGYMTEITEQQNLDKLLEFLKSKSLPIAIQPDTQKPIHFAVGYDAPFKFWNRKNEIWLVAA